MGHSSLGIYYNTNFSLMQHHHWSITELESMIPWERYIYIDLLQGYLAAEETKARDREAEERARTSMMRRRAG